MISLLYSAKFSRSFFFKFALRLVDQHVLVDIATTIHLCECGGCGRCVRVWRV